jgi:signal transduction histidine kinase
MPYRTIRTRLLAAFALAIFLPSIITTIVAVTRIQQQVFAQAQEQVTSDLEAAKQIYARHLDALKSTLRMHATRRVFYSAMLGHDTRELGVEIERVRAAEGLDILTLVDSEGRVFHRARNPSARGDSLASDALVAAVLRDGKPVAATAIIEAARLAKESPALVAQASMTIVPTPKAAPTSKSRIQDGMFLEGAAPVSSPDGQVVGVLVGGILLNRSTEIVDEIRAAVFEPERYAGEEVGAATISQDDVRISTNVRLKDGSRAVSTRSSAEVADAVHRRGQPLHGRAFVVNDWYVAAYEPIFDHAGKAIGMLYVGTLERRYQVALSRHLMVLWGLTAAGMLVAGAFAMWVAERISRPIKAMSEAAVRVGRGDYSGKIAVTSRDEIGLLADRFNGMTEDLARAQKEIKTWREDLERIISERTDQLKAMQAEMVQTEKLASLGALVSGIAHEINNPNTFIRGNICLIAEALADILPRLDEIASRSPDLRIARLPYSEFRSQIELLVADMAHGADKIMTIVNDLRKFARRDEGMLDEEVCINTVVNSCARLVQNEVSCVAKLELVLAPELPKFSGNVQKMEQVIVNIVINAAHAIAEAKRPGRICLQTRRDDGQIVVEVSDNGIGMSDEVMQRIFDPFFTTKRPKNGTGLGLSIAYGIISDHGGTIEVRSRCDVGSTFTIKVPLDRPPRKPDRVEPVWREVV